MTIQIFKCFGECKKLILYIFIVAFLISIPLSVSATAITQDLHLNLQTTYSNGSIETGTFDFVFNISNSSGCEVENVIYSNLTSLTTDSRGIISYYLPDVTLGYDIQYWLCYYRDGSLVNNSKIARTPYAFRAQNVTLSGVEVDQNLDLGNYNATTTGTGFFGWLGSLVSRITTLFVQDINASGQINATQFLQNGNVVLDASGFSYTNITDEPWIESADEGNLNVNSSDYWDGLDTFNSSELEQQSDGNLGILDSFINLLIDNRVTQAFVEGLGFFTEAEILGFSYFNTSNDGAGSNLDADLIDTYDSTFFMPLNTSVVGDFDFTGGWTFIIFHPYRVILWKLMAL